MQGLSIKTHLLKSALFLWPVHLLVQLISFGVAPLLAYGLSFALTDRGLATGLIVAGCVPTAIASTVVMTQKAGGNEATALVNATFGNLIGVLVSPALLLLYIGETTLELPFGQILGQLGYTVLGPLFVGQVALYLFPGFCDKVKKLIPLRALASLALIVIVWASFSKTFMAEYTVRGTQILILLAFCILLFGSLNVLALTSGVLLSRVLDQVTRKDVIAVIFCAPAKTLALGITLITLVFTEGGLPAGIVGTPLLIYHPMQLVIQAGVTELVRWHWKRYPDGAERVR